MTAPRFGRIGAGPSPAPGAEAFTELAAAGGARVERIASRGVVAGDWALLPAGCRHRVAWTDPAAETLWLAVHLPPD